MEIRCPADCGYLTTARHHPPAVVQRRRERDASFFVGLAQDLSKEQYQLLLLLQSVVVKHRATSIPPLGDADVADAASALASTLETADRGIIYEHRATSLLAQSLTADWNEAIDQVAQTFPRAPRLASAALRRIERGAIEAPRALEPGNAVYLDLLDRMMKESVRSTDGALDRRAPDAPRVIVP
ncbi:MAG: hypothetical protein HYX76_07010 [Acidobacteria bacterium]|nr:hypothetical protein [Acidobacteriota bacterium]